LRTNSLVPSFEKTLSALTAIFLLLVTESCGTPSESPFRRLAIPPANILIDDDSSDWLGAAIPIILQQNLAAAKDTASSITPNDSSAYAIQATSIAAVAVTREPSGFHLDFVLRDAATQRTTAVIRSSASPDVVTAVDLAAKHIDAAAIPFPTHNETALRAFVEAAGSRDLPAAIQHLQDAVRADPRFGAAQTALLSTKARAGASDLNAVLQSALEYRNAFTPLDRARFDLTVARIRHVPLEKQRQAASAVLQLAPHDMEALSLAGSVSFLEGDPAAAERFLSHAVTLAPANSEVRLQLAQGFLETKQFRRAEALFVQGQMQVEIVNRAVCVLLAGDSARANSIMNDFLQAQEASRNPLAPLIRAEWTASTGALENAIAFLHTASFANPALAALADAHKEVWQAMLKKSGSAIPKISAPGVDDASLSGYHLFLARDYAAAAIQWQSASNASGGMDLRSRAMLASCFDRLHRTQEIPALRVEPFAPNLSGTDPFSVLPFLEMRRLLRL
jgi:tetratricopeptide (TPR) repeat protein